MTETVKISKVVNTIISHHNKNKRSFPWRENINPYRVLVSEYMLQQTQTNRVVSKYTAFIERFPDVYSLARASRRSVIEQWMGLGYNRRAVALHKTAHIIVNKYGGVIPNVKEELLNLPGIGKYTAGAVLAFAYNKEVVLVETNIRTVVMHHCIKEKENISDSSVEVFVEQMVQYAGRQGIDSRTFYTAFMDYGAYLKRNGVTINVRSRHYTKQKAFAGSVRKTRGEILRMLLKQEGGVSRKEIRNLSGKPQEAIDGLVADGIVEKQNNHYYLCD